MKKLLAALAPLTAAACASTGTPAPITYAGRAPLPLPPPVPAPPQPVSLYATAPHAMAAGELRICSGGGSNLGPVSINGASLLYTPFVAANSLSLMRNPTQSSCLSSGYGQRALASGGGKSHTGLDLASATGGYIYAAGDARVVAVEWRGDYGLVVELDHGANVHTIYAHLSEADPALARNSFVTAGQPIARMGATGNATGVHLHYELVVDGVKVDPLKYGLPPIADDVS